MVQYGKLDQIVKTPTQTDVKIPARVKLAIHALKRRRILQPELSGLDVWVVSPGGVGTTFLMEYLSNFACINDPYDADGLKHWPRPPSGVTLDKAPQMLFIYGKPDQIVASITRRHWIRTQSAKIGSLGGVLLNGQAQRRVFQRSVEAQIAAWKNCTSGKLRCIEFNELWDNVGAIARHVGIDEGEFGKCFPPRKKRNTD